MAQPNYVKKYILGYRIITYLLLVVINFACIFWKVPSEAIGQFCYFITYTAQCCVLTNSSPLGVGQAPVENSWGTYKTKNVAQKKLA